ncbi:MAG: 30S ribosomal protein S6e [Methanofastidiosum sp.]|jgi:small subunit ribosomal protein S6e|nr:30S ribosomal protein S6e [Methanofastidiosum sp.]
MEYKIIVSYQDGKTIQKEVKDKQAEPLFGLKIGEEFNGEKIGLSGHVLKITGGSDKDGFPMRQDLDGDRRVKLLLSKSVGFRPVEQGERRKKRVRGNVINEDTVQINTKVIKPEKYENPEEKKAEEVPKESKS